jgi:hypothetical protein
MTDIPCCENNVSCCIPVDPWGMNFPINIGFGWGSLIKVSEMVMILKFKAPGDVKILKSAVTMFKSYILSAEIGNKTITETGEPGIGEAANMFQQIDGFEVEHKIEHNSWEMEVPLKYLIPCFSDKDAYLPLKSLNLVLNCGFQKELFETTENVTLSGIDLSFTSYKLAITLPSKKVMCKEITVNKGEKFFSLAICPPGIPSEIYFYDQDCPTIINGTITCNSKKYNSFSTIYTDNLQINMLYLDQEETNPQITMNLSLPEVATDNRKIIIAVSYDVEC